MSNILLVDEYGLVRAGIKRLLTDHDMIGCVDEAASSHEALLKVRGTNPDIVIMDLGSEHLSVFDVTRRMLAAQSNLKVIVLTSRVDDPFPARILKAGAMACLGKRCSLNDLFSAIKAVQCGKRYVSTDVAQSLAERGNSSTAASPFLQLSNRELQIMCMFVSGMKVNAIAEHLCLSPKTVSTYRYRIFAKLGVRGDVELTHLALRYGMLQEGKMRTAEQRRAG